MPASTSRTRTALDIAGFVETASAFSVVLDEETGRDDAFKAAPKAAHASDLLRPSIVELRAMAFRIGTSR